MKTKMIMGMAIAAVMTVTSVGAFAAETDYGYISGRANGSKYESVDERVDTESYGFHKGAGKNADKSGYGFRKGGDLDARLEAGEITQEEYDAIKAGKDNKGAKLDEKLAAGEITQEEYDAIKSENKARHEKMTADGTEETDKSAYGFNKGKTRTRESYKSETAE